VIREVVEPCLSALFVRSAPAMAHPPARTDTLVARAEITASQALRSATNSSAHDACQSLSRLAIRPLLTEPARPRGIGQRVGAPLGDAGLQRREAAAGGRPRRSVVCDWRVGFEWSDGRWRRHLHRPRRSR
jgi:hypothetical protein